MSINTITETEIPEPTSEKAYLIVLLGTDAGRAFPVDSSVLIGRSDDAEIRLEARGISRRHARILRDDKGRYLLRDLESKNGTRVNGAPIGATTLRFGDKIFVGPETVILFTRYEPLEEQMLHLQKMQSMGKLAAGISHDFNNLLGVVISSLEYLSDPAVADRAHDPEFQECLQDAVQASRKAVELTKQLLGFANPRETNITRFDISLVIREVAKLARRTFEQAIEIQLDVSPEIYVKGNQSQLAQVLMNLFVNARDAMLDGGRLTVQAHPAGREKSASIPISSLDKYIMIAVTDTGIGMDAETASQIFEPFFTTKTDSGGIGLGLATTFGIVRNHGGHITVDSQLNTGTTFRIYLPSAEYQREMKATIDVSGYSAQSEIQRSMGPIEVLLVDDEELVLRSIERLLSRVGIKVHTASTARQTIETFIRHRETIDVVLLDLNIPESKGEDIFCQLRTIDSEVKVVVFSGCSDERRIRNLMREGAVGFIPKPADTDSIIRSLRLTLSDDGVANVGRSLGRV